MQIKCKLQINVFENFYYVLKTSSNVHTKEMVVFVCFKEFNSVLICASQDIIHNE